MALTPWNRQEEWYQQIINASTGKYLPSVSAQDAGKVLAVGSDGGWVAQGSLELTATRNGDTITITTSPLPSKENVADAYKSGKGILLRFASYDVFLTPFENNSMNGGHDSYTFSGRGEDFDGFKYSVSVVFTDINGDWRCNTEFEETKPLYVGLYPNAADYSGAMNTTVAEIYDALINGREVFGNFNVDGEFSLLTPTASAVLFDGYEYPRLEWWIIADGKLGCLYVGQTNDPDENTYSVTTYDISGDYISTVSNIDDVDNPNENKLYRVKRAVLFSKYGSEDEYEYQILDNATIVCVSSLPASNQIPVTTDTNSFTFYLSDTDDENIYGWVTADIGSQYSIPEGWYTFVVLGAMIGTTWGGVYTDPTEAEAGNSKMNALVYYDFASYKGGVWNYITQVKEYTNKLGMLATVEGDFLRNEASGGFSHAEGQKTLAEGEYSHAEGYMTTARGSCSHAEGSESGATGNYSHAENYSFADGSLSHSEGSLTYANATASHSEGMSTRADGIASHAEGSETHAYGDSSHAEGYNTIANSFAQHVFGMYNIPDIQSAASRGNYVEIVGKGIGAGSESNARTLDWSGNEKLAGGLTLGMGTADETTITAAQLKSLLAMLN